MQGQEHPECAFTNPRLVSEVQRTETYGKRVGASPLSVLGRWWADCDLIYRLVAWAAQAGSNGLNVSGRLVTHSVVCAAEATSLWTATGGMLGAERATIIGSEDSPRAACR